MVSFDAGGVSGHANHISLYTALRYSVLHVFVGGLAVVLQQVNGVFVCQQIMTS